MSESTPAPDEPKSAKNRPEKAAAQSAPTSTPVDDGKKSPEDWARATDRVRRGKTRVVAAVNGNEQPRNDFIGEHRAAVVLRGWTSESLVTREEYETAISEAKNHGAPPPKADAPKG